MSKRGGILRFGYDLLSLPAASRISDTLLSLRFALASSKNLQSDLPKVTLVIPVYQVERYIELCLESVVAQNYKNLEVIVVDDGSTDSSMQRVKKFESKLNLKIVTQENAGLAVARNAGVRAIKSTRYLMFLDSDDALAPGALEALVTQAEKSNSDFVVGDCTRMKGLTRLKRVDTRAVYAQGSQTGVTFKDAPQVIRDVTAWNKLFRWDFYQHAKISFPSGVYFEDMAEMTRAYIDAEKFDILARAVYLWRVRTEGAKSITQSASSDKQFTDRFAALQQMRELVDSAIAAGKASKANLDAFADRVRTHDTKLHPDRLEELKALTE